jgi:hypothetical protein
MGNRFDQLGKKIGLRALGPSGLTVAQDEIPSNARHADLRHEPDAAREAERARLGLLGRLVSVLCLIEFFSGTPDEEGVLAALGKLIAFWQQRRREADKARRSQREGDAAPAAPLVKPFLWIITAGRPSSVLSLLGAVPAEGWPTGVYLSPGALPDAGRHPAGLQDAGGLLRVGIVVASELPRDRSTILVRIIAGGAALPAALADLAALPAGAHERYVASMDLLELRQVLGKKTNRTVQEEEFIVSTQNIVEKLQEEARREGRDEGRREGLAEGEVRALLTALRVRGIAVSDVERERILGQEDPKRLERWLERAIVATSLAEVLDEPS